MLLISEASPQLLDRSISFIFDKFDKNFGHHLSKKIWTNLGCCEWHRNIADKKVSENDSAKGLKKWQKIHVFD